MASAELFEAACASQAEMIQAQLQLLRACACAAAGLPVIRGSTTERMVAHAYASGIAQLALLAGALEHLR